MLQNNCHRTFLFSQRIRFCMHKKVLYKIDLFEIFFTFEWLIVALLYYRFASNQYSLWQRVPCQKLRFGTCVSHCKKELAIFPSPAGLSLTKLSLGGKKLNYSRPGRVWSVTSRLGTGKRPTLFYSAPTIKGWDLAELWMRSSRVRGWDLAEFVDEIEPSG